MQSTDIFDVAAERQRFVASRAAIARRRQPAHSAAIVTAATRLSEPETVLRDAKASNDTLIELHSLLDEQASLLTSAEPEQWRAAARDYFKTDRQFTLAYLDPPWRYKTAMNRSCSTKPHYDTMSDDELAAMPLRGLMLPDAALAMWTTAPKMAVATRLLALWGFEFRTVFLTWIKVTASGQHPIYSTGGGYTRPNAEFLLLATRGKLHVTARAAGSMVDSVLETRRAEHSHKPNVVRDMLVAVFGDRTRIELFTRETVPGWHAWGNEVTKFNELYALPTKKRTAGDDDDDGDDNGEVERREDAEDNDDDIEAASAKRARLLPVRPGRSRANNRSAKRGAPKTTTPLRAGARDVGPASVTSYYNKPAEGTKMTINDFILRGYESSELRQYNRVTDLRSLFGTVPSDAQRHSTYPTLTIDEARKREPLIRRLQEHNDEMLFATNVNTARRPVRYTDAEMADVLCTLSAARDAGLTASEDEMLNGNDVPTAHDGDIDTVEL